MAKAPGHKLGQIIGNELEAAVEPLLQAFADEHALYLDRKGPRLTRPDRTKLVWKDGLGNSHELDYVLERAGTASEVGVPAAFVETAWRRYTRHSKNKAQEIQGAISALLQTYKHARPFAGVVLAGAFTNGSLEQLRSNGFSVVHIPAATVAGVFGSFGIDIAAEDSTADEQVQEQIGRYGNLLPSELQGLRGRLRQAVSDQLQDFTEALRTVVLRRVETVSVALLYGEPRSFVALEDAISMLRQQAATPPPSLPLARLEVSIEYTGTDPIVDQFGEAEQAVRFLESFR
jgi:hypothetical protein